MTTASTATPVTWSGRRVYHGTDTLSAASILSKGVDVSRSVGYFGKGFYVAEDLALAKSNYADFAEDDGVVLEWTLSPMVRVLDLREPAHFDQWQQFLTNAVSGRLDHPDLPKIAQANGIDAVFDNSMGGLCVYAAGVLQDPKVADHDVGLVQLSPQRDRVWVHSFDGSTVGRFSVTFGMDVHNTVTDQLSGMPQCLACTHEAPTLQDWTEFCALMFEHHRVHVPVDAIDPELLQPSPPSSRPG